MNNFNKFKITALSTAACIGMAIVPEMHGEASQPNYFAEASHIPPESCEDDIRLQLGSRALESLYLDLRESRETSAPTPQENRLRAAELPSIPDGSMEVNSYSRLTTWQQENIELPDSGIALDVRSNVLLKPLDSQMIDDAIYASLSYEDPGNPLRTAVYTCLRDAIYEDMEFDRLTIRILYLSGIVIRDNFAIDSELGQGTVGGRFVRRSNTIILAASENQDAMDSKFFHELGHALNWNAGTYANNSKKIENFAVMFNRASKIMYFEHNPDTNVFEEIRFSLRSPRTN
ncbi:MAG: hypothetical protein M3Q36_01440 [bacterium]|nr:hypothetical protein [bacterium]